MVEIGQPAADIPAYITERTRDFAGREWVFGAIDKWLTDPKGSRVFLLTGEPGCGKTVIAARLAQFSQGACTPPEGLTAVAPGFLSAIHFCSARDYKWYSPNSFAESLALQLAARYPATFAKTLAEVSGDRKIHIEVHQEATVLSGKQVGVEIHHLDTSNASEQDAFLRSVRKPLEAHCREKPAEQVVILVDALDEALVYRGDVSIVDLLARAQDLPTGVRFLLASQPERPILQELKDHNPHICWLSEGEGLTRSLDDVRRYVMQTLEQHPELRAQLASEFSAAAFVAAIQVKSSGNFLYTSNLLKTLAVEESQISAASLDQLPAGIEGIYSRFLARLADDEWATNHAPILGTLAVARQTLTETHLANFCGVGRSKMRRHLGPLRPLLDVDDALPASQRTYRLYHHSFAKFLLDEDRAGDYWCEAEEQHERVASYYLKEHQNGWQSCDEYGMNNLAIHLLESGRLDKLQSLITKDWSRARSRHGFEADARLAWPDRDARIRHFRQATQDQKWQEASMLLASDLHISAVEDLSRNRLESATTKLTEAASAAAYAAQLAQTTIPTAHINPAYLHAVNLRGYIATKMAQVDQRNRHWAAQAQHLQEAAEFLEEVKRLDPDNAEALNEWGNVQLYLGDPDTAIAAHLRAIELYAWYTAAYWDLALTFHHKMETDPERAHQWGGKAIDAWERAHLLAPYDSGFSESDIRTIRRELQKLYSSRGWNRLTDGDYAGAEEDFTSAIARGNDDADSYYARCFARFYQGKFKAAENDATIAIDKGRDDVSVYQLRSIAREKQGNHAGAQADAAAAGQRDQADDAT